MAPGEIQRREFLHTVVVQRALVSALGIARSRDYLDAEVEDCHSRDRAIDFAIAAHRSARDIDADNLRWERDYLRRLIAVQESPKPMKPLLRIVASLLFVIGLVAPVSAQDLCTGPTLTTIAIGVPFKVAALAATDTSHLRLMQRAPGSTAACLTAGTGCTQVGAEVQTTPGTCVAFDVPAFKQASQAGDYLYTVVARNVDPSGIAALHETPAPAVPLKVFQPQMPKPGVPGVRILATRVYPDGRREDVVLEDITLDGLPPTLVLGR